MVSKEIANAKKAATSFIQDLIGGGVKKAKSALFNQSSKLQEKLKGKAAALDLDWLIDEAGAGLIRGEGSDTLVDTIATVIEVGIDTGAAYVGTMVTAGSGGTASAAALGAVSFVAKLANDAKKSVVSMIKGDSPEENNFEKGEWVIIHTGRERRRMPALFGSEEDIRDIAAKKDAIEIEERTDVAFVTDRSKDGMVNVQDIETGEFRSVNVKMVQKLGLDMQDRLNSDEILSGVKSTVMQTRSNTHKRLDGPNTAPGSTAFMEDGTEVVIQHVDGQGRCTVFNEGTGKRMYIDYNKLTKGRSKRSNNPVPGNFDNGFMQDLGFAVGEWVWVLIEGSLYQLAVVSGIGPNGITIYFALTGGMRTVPPDQCEKVNSTAYQYTNERLFGEFQNAVVERDFDGMAKASRIITETYTRVTEVSRTMRREWFYIVPRDHVENITWGGRLEGDKVHTHDNTDRRAKEEDQVNEYEAKYGRGIGVPDLGDFGMPDDDTYFREKGFTGTEKEPDSSNVTVYVFAGVAAVAVIYFATK